MVWFLLPGFVLMLSDVHSVNNALSVVATYDAGPIELFLWHGFVIGYG
jgi:hypothetical protein